MTCKPYDIEEHPDHKAQWGPWAQKWIKNALSTEPMTDAERAEALECVAGLYDAAALQQPLNVVFAEGPVTGAFAAAAAAYVWQQRSSDAPPSEPVLYGAVQQLCDLAFDDSPEAAASCWQVAVAAIRQPGVPDPVPARKVPKKLLTGLVEALAEWDKMRNGGNEYSAWVSFIAFFRHVARLDLSHGIDYSKWDYNERAAICSGPRYTHDKFCIVSDRPLSITMDDRARLHSITGPAKVWRDGVKMYAVNGVEVPAEWVEQRDTVDPTLALTHPNVEQRLALCTILGWERVLEGLNPRVIDEDDPEIGTLLEVDLPDSPNSRFLRVLCGTGRTFVLPVPQQMKTALEANAASYGLNAEDLKVEVRT